MRANKYAPKVNGNARQSGTGIKERMNRKDNRPNVVVLGAGFGGVWAAKMLAKGPVNVLLVDRHNYHTFFPLMYQVGAAELEPEAVAQPLRRIFWNQPNVHYYPGEIQDIDVSAKTVRISEQEVPYDYLVVGIGSQPNFFNIPGAEQYAFTMKSLEQSIVLRNHIIKCFELAAVETTPEARKRWLTFTVVGGGPTGVEFAGALMELVHGAFSKDFPEIDMEQVHVILLEASDHLLDGMPNVLSDYAQARLKRMGADPRLDSPVVEIAPDEVLLKNGTSIPCRTVIWTAGVNGNIRGNRWGFKTNRHNQVEVLPTLQVPDHPEVYVVGDLAGIQQDGRPLPQVAQMGMQTGTTAGKNILRQMVGKPPLAFRYHDKGTMDVIGRNAAAAYIWGIAFHGFLAWLLWAGVHIFYLIGFRNRLMVLIDWAWDYLFAEHGVRIILSDSEWSREKPAAGGKSMTTDLPERPKQNKTSPEITPARKEARES